MSRELIFSCKTMDIHKRNLPHFEKEGSVYFVTFRLLRKQELNDQERTIVLDCIKYSDNDKYNLYCAVVMPDHVHIIMQPLGKMGKTKQWHSLSDILRVIKGYSAKLINEERMTQGALWQDESFDRIIRNEAELIEKWNYIQNNPVEAGLVNLPNKYAFYFAKIYLYTLNIIKSANNIRN